MTMLDATDLERELTSALAVLPTGGSRARMDARVSSAMASPAERRFGRSVVARPRMAATIALCAAAMVAIAAGGLTLLEQTFRHASPGWQVAWDRATPIGASQTVDGVTVGVERAYMDAAHVIIGLTTDGYHYARADLRIDGQDVPGAVVEGVPSDEGSASVLVFHTPASVGEQAQLMLEIPSLYGPGAEPETVAGPWRFAFDVPNAGGVTWTGASTAVASDVTITLERLSVSPTLITGAVTWSGAPLAASEGDMWSIRGRVEHAGDQFPIEGSGSDRISSDFRIERGSDDPTGEWTVLIEELTSDPGSPPQHIRLPGPWELKVTLPG